jgi:hypothetical protein
MDRELLDNLFESYLNVYDGGESYELDKVTGGGLIKGSGTKYSAYSDSDFSPAQKRRDLSRSVGPDQAGIRSRYSVGTREVIPSRNAGVQQEA